MKKKGNVPIAYIITKLELGGAQKVCLSLFHELQKKEHPTWLISGTEGPLVQTVQHLPNVLLIPSLKRECSWRTLGNEFRTFFSLFKILRKLSLDNPNLVVHTHSTKAGYLGRWAAFFAGTPQRIHTIHGFGFHTYQSRLSYTIAYLLELFTSLITTHYVCVSTQDQATGNRLLPWFSQKNSLIRAAINDQKFFPALSVAQSYEAQHFIFGTVSCFKKQKNLFDLLTAFEQVYRHHPRARLEIIGDGYLRPQIEAWIIEKRLEDIIVLHGWQNEVALYMKRWHVFVMSSLWEGLPCAAVEARFLKLPVLSYNVGGISDLIISGKNGFLYEPRNIQQLAEGMNSLITDKDLYQKLKVYTEDLSDFTRSAMILQHSLLYRYVATSE
jgi:glycosyltransferase involved in cell wall biosynthesis